TAGVGQELVATADRKAIPIDAGVPEGSILLGPAGAISEPIF
ncbi:MAG: L,D-transpeptidase, partial [Mesorhizobium sp.]